MHTPPPSSEMFYSSPHGTNTHSGPADEVYALIAQAQAIEALNPAIEAFFAASPNNRKSFFAVFARRLQLIKSRSQAFEDAHVTVYDKTLLILTSNGNNLENPPAVEFFCEEFLAINSVAGPEKLRAIEESTTLPIKLTHDQPELSPPPSTVRCSTIEQSIEKTYSGSERRASMKTESSYDSMITKIPEMEMEPKLARLWSVYEKARTDYQAVSGRNDTKAVAASRFLRDTAENTIEYLNNKNSDPLMMAELKATYDLAKASAVSMTGGKKRKFDYPEMDRVKGTPRAPRNTPTKSRRRGPYSNIAHDSIVRTQFAEEQVRGRGHSGVPFGYSRPVDSYHPH